MPFSESLRQQTLLSSDVSQMPPDTLTSAYIMPLHRRHARQHRPERVQRRHFSLQLSVRQRCRASASSSDAKIPSAEAARAAPVSFIALPRVMASLSRAIASSSKEPRLLGLPWSATQALLLSFPKLILFAETSTTSLRTDRSDWMTNPGMAYPGMTNPEEDL